ncbi:MAG TPA: acetyl-CoA carboxylase carboxyl transferase subunit alpha [Ruminococcaceae bacterium]|nr:acetyl-CoA carboxylase carboxyl transferase subunit alpha [Oscillospiraceae bacterium]
MADLSAWERIQIVHEKNRPTIHDYIPLLFDDFLELHGDRNHGDDGAILGGIAIFRGRPITVVGMVKGRNFDENKRANFAMPSPEGYRKALRLIKQAEKFHRPVICLVDTPGANPSIGAEERGQGEAIAYNIMQLFRVRTPIVSVIMGEGGSGGALALAVCDELGMLSNAVYSVISPRGFASILWKDSSREQEAAELLKMTAEDLIRFSVADTIVKEPAGGAQTDPQAMADSLGDYLWDALSRLSAQPLDTLLERRYDKFRKIGEFAE